MSTEDDVLAAELAEDQAGLDLAQAYAHDLPQDVIEDLARKSKGPADFGEKLGDAKREIAVKEATEIAAKSAEARFDELVEEHGLDEPYRTKAVEPEPEEKDPEGHWLPSEGDPWPVVADKFTSGAMSLADYEREREARGMEALH